VLGHRVRKSAAISTPENSVAQAERLPRVFLINPSDKSFGIAVITPRWLYVLAAATPEAFGDPSICDETLRQIDVSRIERGDVVGIGIHTGNALRGYEIGSAARDRGAFVVFGGIHATLYPEEALTLGGAHSVVKGDGDVVWAKALRDCVFGKPREIYEGGKIPADQFFTGSLGSVAEQQLHVGLGSNHSGMP
jgi:hypothetical protein